MPHEVSTFRAYLLRAVYLLNFVGLGAMVWPVLLNHQGPWDPLHGVAFSFWAALSLLAGVGIRYPLKMLPVLFVQLLYKSIWLLAVMLPAQAAGRTFELTDSMILPVIVDLIVIPWPYVVRAYIRSRGDTWSRARGPVLSPSESA